MPSQQKHWGRSSEQLSGGLLSTAATQLQALCLYLVGEKWRCCALSLSHCRLSVVSNQPDNADLWLLTVTSRFPSHNCCSINIIFWTHRECKVSHLSRSAAACSPSCTNIHVHYVQSHFNPLCSRILINLNFSLWSAAMWLADWKCKQLHFLAYESSQRQLNPAAQTCECKRKNPIWHMTLSSQINSIPNGWIDTGMYFTQILF